MAVPTEVVMNSSLNDPVTKAVVDNIMGNLPTKKPFVRCDDCDLSFTSQTVLDTHLQGARHAKQIRSKNIMASLEETKVAFSKDEETNGLKCEWSGKEVGSTVTSTPINAQDNSASKDVSLSCNMCNKIFNSPTQYNVHITSKKHTSKLKQAKILKKKRFFPYWKKPKPGSNPKNLVQSLSNNFVPGGFTNQT